MKTSILCLWFVSGTFLSVQCFAAPAAGGGGGVSGSGGGASIAPMAPGIPRVNPISGTPGSRELQPGVGPQKQVSDQTTATMATNQAGMAMTNQIAGATNGLPGTNGGAGANNTSSSVAVTGNPMGNAVINPSTQINGNLVVGDQATTPSDRVLLTTLGQGVRSTLGITANNNLPVHFMINNGTVTVVGTVQNAAQTQGIMSQVQQTPGVLSVINDLHVAPPPGTAQSRAGELGVFGGASDHAFSPRDQTLLTTVQQQAAMQLGVNSTAQMPVHFSIQNGVVGVTGQVSSRQEKQAILAAIQQTPGITRVVDNIGVLGGAAGMTPSVGPVGNGAVNGINGNNSSLPPTSTEPSQSNSVFLNTAP